MALIPSNQNITPPSIVITTDPIAIGPNNPDLGSLDSCQKRTINIVITYKDGSSRLEDPYIDNTHSSQRWIKMRMYIKKFAHAKYKS